MTFEDFEQIETTEHEQLIALVATHFQVNPTAVHWNGAEGLGLIKYYKALVDRNATLRKEEAEQREAEYQKRMEEYKVAASQRGE